MQYYSKSELISYGSPDQYQFRQNELLKKMAEFILTPYWEWQSAQNEKNNQEDGSMVDL